MLPFRSLSPRFMGPAPSLHHLRAISFFSIFIFFFPIEWCRRTLRIMKRYAPTPWKPLLVFLIRANHQIYAKIAIPGKADTSKRVVVDIGAGPNVARPSALPDDYRQHLKPLTMSSHVYDANGNPLHFQGTIPFFVSIGRYRVKATFLVRSALNTDLILGTQFLDRRARAILPIVWYIVMKDWSSAMLDHKDRQPLEHSRGEALRPSEKVKCAAAVLLPPRTQVWIDVGFRKA